MDNNERVFLNNCGVILLREDLIEFVGSSSEFNEQFKELTSVWEVDLEGNWVIPGLINTHVHTSQHLARGLGDDVDLLTWLHERIWPYESNMSPQDSYISTLLCAIEQIRSGCTCIAEAGGQHEDSIAEAIAKAGIRVLLTRSTMDSGEGLPSTWKAETTETAINKQIQMYNKHNNTAEGRIRVWFSIRTIFNATNELLEATKQLAREKGVGIHMHVAEIQEEVNFCKEKHGLTTVSHLNKIGLLSDNFLAVHSVWLSDEEIEMYKDNKVNVSHCPAAAMRYLGFARVPEMVEKGINVSIGTDGAPSNNRMTMVDEMWLTNLIHKGRTLKQTVVPSEQVLRMATINGAKAVLWENQIGSLEKGKKADLAVICPDTANMLPLHDPVSSIVTAMQQHNIESTMCNGRWLMWKKKIATVDEEEVFALAKKHAKEIVQRANIKLPTRFTYISQ